MDTHTVSSKPMSMHYPSSITHKDCHKHTHTHTHTQTHFLDIGPTIHNTAISILILIYIYICMYVLFSPLWLCVWDRQWWDEVNCVLYADKWRYDSAPVEWSRLQSLGQQCLKSLPGLHHNQSEPCFTAAPLNRSQNSGILGNVVSQCLLFPH